MDFTRGVFAVGGFFGLRSIFDLVMRGQRSNSREIGNFSDFHVHISGTINYNDMKPLPLYSPFDSEQVTCCFSVLIKYLGCMASGKIARGHTGPMALDNIGSGKEAV